MEIRIANPAEIEDIRKILTKLDHPKFTPSQSPSLVKRIEEKNCYIAVNKGKINGIMFLDLEDNNCQIWAIATTEKGVGKQSSKLQRKFAKKKIFQNYGAGAWIGIKQKDSMKKWDLLKNFYLKNNSLVKIAGSLEKLFKVFPAQ